MPAKDIYHDAVKNALTNDGWTITHDPLKLQVGLRKMFVDLGAEKLIAAEKNDQKIAVEIKSFISRSEIDDLEDALGQYVLYKKVLAKTEPQRKIFLAIKQSVYVSIFEDEIGKILLENGDLCLLVFDENREEIVKWIN